MGDFNAKHSSWGCDVDTRRGITFNHHIQRSGYRILAPPTPRYGHDSASTLDLAISTNVDWPCTVTSISELSSDHNPVTFEFTTTTHFFPPPNKRYTHMKTNWGKFTQNLNIPDNFTLPEANTPEDIDEQIAAFTDRLHQAYKNASKPLKHNDTFYISRDLNQLFKERNRARKIWHYTRSPADKNTLNRLQKQIKKIVLKHEQKQWDESLACLEAEDGSLWKAARNSRKKAQPIPALKGPAKIAYSDADKSEVIADSLQNQFKLNDISNDTDRAITHVVHTYLNNENNFTNIPPPPPLPSEIIDHIDKVKINKAAGIDRTTNRMLKHLPLVPIFELTNIIHNIIKIGYFPIVWKTATVVPILKPGKDPTQAESFRPIALLSILGKVAEKIILKRLYHHVEENNILIPEQHGFRPDLSTTHQLLRVVETIKSGFKNKKSTGAVFLDIQKAFDRVWREGLIFKLIKYDFPPPLIKLISSYLTDRNFSVRINDTYSSHRPTEAGVAQGTLISPLLFNIYVNDIPIHHNTTLCMFADDTAILASHTEPKLVARAINRHLLVLEDWFSKWKIALNVAKTEAVFFTRKTRLIYPDIYLHNEKSLGLRAPNILVLR
ncbi:probable RNA-directed DNA polymerase from transposon X-element [Trichonephila clavipes]|nr:probable RNA-directed DNA polymerase from transposon X-element [Trichonephila clavipes]